MNFIDMLVDAYNKPPKKYFDYDKGQNVRILKSLTVDTHYITDLLGQIGIVEDRYVTGIHKENKYVVRFRNGRLETFDETELDQRYIKRKTSDPT